jgi:nicotinamidase/pyrazinamidase
MRDSTKESPRGGRSRPLPTLRAGDAVLVIDVQRDFCAGGALAVPDADAVVPVLNRWTAAAHAAGVPVFFTRDWHPPRHVSFRRRGGPWPPHCVQDTPGAAFHAALRLPATPRVVSKGVRPDRDQTSAFDATGLDGELRALGVRRLWVGGLAADVCVRDTVLDGLRRGFAVHVIEGGTRAVRPEAITAVLDELQEAGAAIAEEAA